MKKLAYIALLGAWAVLQTGCTSLHTVEEAKGSGEYRIYNKPFDTVWVATIDAINDLPLELVSSERSTGTILAQRGVTLMSWGERVAVFEDEVGEKSATRVEVVSQKMITINITAPDWTDRIFDAIDEKLEVKR